MFFLKVSDICQTIAHNLPEGQHTPLTRQQLRMSLVHRSKNEGEKKFLGRKGGGAAQWAQCIHFHLKSFLCGSPRVTTCSPLHSFSWFSSIRCHSPHFPTHVLLWVNKSHSNDKTSQQDGSCTQTQRAGRPLSLFFLSMGRQRSSRNMQEQSPANLLHSGQRDSSRDKQPPVERPVYCGQRVC